jgi:hypothetical protein
MNFISQTDMAIFGASNFAKKEVLFDNAQKDERKIKLFRAMILHFIDHETVQICVSTANDESFTIECEVIAVTDEHIILKSGLVIPIAAISLIELM